MLDLGDGPAGLSASVYTQITDVEGELNGFLTYDRQVAKMDLAQVRAINQQIIAAGRRLRGQRPAAAAGHPGPDRRRLLPAGRHDATDEAGDHDAHHRRRRRVRRPGALG